MPARPQLAFTDQSIRLCRGGRTPRIPPRTHATPDTLPSRELNLHPIELIVA